MDANKQPAPHDVCDNCSRPYYFRPGVDLIYIYLRRAICNHVEAHCPHCGQTCRIYIEAETVVHLQANYGLGIRFYPDASDELVESRQRADGCPEVIETETDGVELPALGCQEHRELYDDFRRFERGEV